MAEFMLDANICVYAMSGRSSELDLRLQRAGAAICLSSIVLAELSYGAENSARPETNRARLYEFLDGLPVVDFDKLAARHYAEIRSALRRKGTPIGPNDLFVAAHARSLDLTLVTNNLREFDRVPGLKVENWV